MESRADLIEPEHYFKLEQMLADTEKDFEELQKECSSKEQEIAAFQAQLQEIKESQAGAELQVKQKDKELNDMTKQYRAMVQKYTEVEAQYLHFKTRYEELAQQGDADRISKQCVTSTEGAQGQKASQHRRRSNPDTKAMEKVQTELEECSREVDQSLGQEILLLRKSLREVERNRDTLQASIDEMRGQLLASNADIQMWKASCDHGKQTVTSLEAVIIENETRSDQLTAAIASLQSKLEQCGEENAKLKALLDASERNRLDLQADLQQELAQYRERVSELERLRKTDQEAFDAEICQMDLDKSAFQSQFDELQSKYSALLSDDSQKSNALATLEQKVKGLLQEKSSDQETILTLQNQLGQITSEKSASLAELEALRIELASINEQDHMKQRHYEELSSTAERFKEELVQTIALNKQLQERLEESEARFFESENVHQDQINSVQHENQQLLDELAALNTLREQISHGDFVERQHYDLVSQELQQITSQYGDLKVEVMQIESKNHEYLSLLDSNAGESIGWQEKISHLSKLLSETQSERDQLRVQDTSSRSLLERKDMELNQLKSQCEDILLPELISLQQAQAVLVNKNNELERALGSAGEKLMTIELREKQLLRLYDEEKTECEDLMMNNAKLIEELKSMQAAVSETENALQVALQEKHALQVNEEQLKREVAFAQTSTKETHTAFEEQEAFRSQLMQTLQAERKEHAQQANKMQNLMACVNDEKERSGNLQKQLEARQLEVESLRNNENLAKDQIDAMNTELEQAHEHQMKLSQSLQKEVTERAKLEEQIEAKTMESTQLREELQNLIASKERNETQAIAKIAELNAQIDDLTNKMTEDQEIASSLMDLVQNEMDDLRDDLAKRVNNNNKLFEKVASAEAASQAMHAELSRAQELVSELQCKLAQSELVLSAVQTQREEALEAKEIFSIQLAAAMNDKQHLESLVDQQTEKVVTLEQNLCLAKLELVEAVQSKDLGEEQLALAAEERDELLSRIGTLTLELESVKSSLDSTTSLVNASKDEIEVLHSTIQQIEAEKVLLTSSSQAALDKEQSLNIVITTLEAQINEAEAKLVDLQQIILDKEELAKESASHLKAQIVEAESKLEAARKDEDSLKNSVASLELQLANTKTMLADAKSEAESTASQLCSLQTTVRELENDKDSQVMKLNQVMEESATIKTQVESLQTELAATKDAASKAAIVVSDEASASPGAAERRATKRLRDEGTDSATCTECVRNNQELSKLRLKVRKQEKTAQELKRLLSDSEAARQDLEELVREAEAETKKLVKANKVAAANNPGKENTALVKKAPNPVL